MLIQLHRSHLPKRRRRSTNSLNIKVMYKGKVRIISDIHTANKNLIYLEKNFGIPVKISDCKLIYNKDVSKARVTNEMFL